VDRARGKYIEASHRNKGFSGRQGLMQAWGRDPVCSAADFPTSIEEVQKLFAAHNCGSFAINRTR
jgi:hypothetical protein